MGLRPPHVTNVSQAFQPFSSGSLFFLPAIHGAGTQNAACERDYKNYLVFRGVRSGACRLYSGHVVISCLSYAAEDRLWAKSGSWLLAARLSSHTINQSILRIISQSSVIIRERQQYVSFFRDEHLPSVSPWEDLKLTDAKTKVQLGGFVTLIANAG